MAVNPVPAREGFVAPETTTAAPEAPPTPEVVESNVEPLRRPEQTWPITVKLIHTPPIRNAKNEMVQALTLRAPTGGDINRCGNPVRLDADNIPVFDERKMTLMIASLSGVLSPVVDTIDARDWNSVAYRLLPFFLPEPLLAW
jgi:hypothetical protein